MPLYRYRVRNKDGLVLSGTLEGVDVVNVVERLDALGYIPIKIKEEKVRAPSTGLKIKIPFLQPRVKLPELITFTRQFVTLHKAGLPMLSAVTALQAQTKNKALSQAIESVRKDLMAGIGLSSALSKFPNVFDELYVNSVWAGETGGVLDEILERVAELLDHERKLRSDILSALRYPMFVIIMFGVAIVVLTTFVLPRFIGLLTSLGSKIPLPTKILIVVTKTLQHYWLIGFLLIVGIASLFYFLIRTKPGRMEWDHLKLRIPIIGGIFFKITLSRFARMFETLDRTGLPILRSLSLVSKTIGNSYIGSKVDSIAESLRRGRGIAAPMRESKVFPPMVIQMVSTGEESGSLDDMLRQISDFYDSEVEYLVKNLTGMIEPILILVLAVGVVFIILAVLMPYMQIITNLGR
jgi:type IV pilus assembly protein PilC